MGPRSAEAQTAPSRLPNELLTLGDRRTPVRWRLSIGRAGRRERRRFSLRAGRSAARSGCRGSPSMPRLGALLLVFAIPALLGGAGLGAWARHESRPRDVRGSPTLEFSPKLRPQNALSREEPWPTYGRDQQRTHFAPFAHRPPFRQIWRINTPGHRRVSADDRVWAGLLQLGERQLLRPGRDERTCHLDEEDRPLCAWPPRRSRTTSSTSPTRFRCHAKAMIRHAPGFVVAWDAATGRELWRHESAAVESSPLLVGNLLYVGAWDGTFYALKARTGKVEWTFDAKASITSSAAYDLGMVFTGTDDGHVFALDARTGALRWQAASFSRFGRREYFYATPTLAYGRVSHRERGRHALRVRCGIGPTPLGTARRTMSTPRPRPGVEKSTSARGTATSRRSTRRPETCSAPRRRGRDHGGADGHGRACLLLDGREVPRLAPATRQRWPLSHVCTRRPNRKGRLAVSGRAILAARCRS